MSPNEKKLDNPVWHSLSETYKTSIYRFFDGTTFELKKLITPDFRVLPNLFANPDF
jgi:hypothetical protein